jgi:hypothetical protein
MKSEMNRLRKEMSNLKIKFAKNIRFKIKIEII